MPSTLTQTLSRVASAYGRKISPELITAWKDTLHGLDDSLVDTAATELMRESDQWMPVPGAVYKRAREIEAAASPHVEPEHHWRRSAVKCLLCKDTGRVSIWTTKSMRSAVQHVQGTIDDEKLRLGLELPGAARCNCEAGDRVHPNKRFGGPDATVRTYDAACMVRIGDSPTRAGQIAELLVWAKTWKPANYTGEFDDWNNGR